MSELTEFLGRDGNRLVADVAGDPNDPPVVLLHGGGQTRHSWGTTLETLGSRGWRVYSVDLRGHGDSEWASDGDYTLDALSEDVLAISRTFERSLSTGASRSSVGMTTTFFHGSFCPASFGKTAGPVLPPGTAISDALRASTALSMMNPMSPATASDSSSRESYSHHSASIIRIPLPAIAALVARIRTILQPPVRCD